MRRLIGRWLKHRQQREQDRRDAYRVIIHSLYRTDELEVCDDCGQTVRLGWAATDEHWNKVVGGYEGHLCIPCFTRRSEAKGIDCRWWAIDADAEEERDYRARIETAQQHSE